MTKNITLKLDENLLKLCRYEAVESDKSLSQWVADVLAERVGKIEEYQKAKMRALTRLNQGFHLGGSPMGRDSTHER